MHDAADPPKNPPPAADPLSGLSSTPPTTGPNWDQPGGSTPDHGLGTGTNEPDTTLLEKIRRASDVAVEQFQSESKKSRGQRGPDKKPRKIRPKNGVPMDGLGVGADPALGPQGPPEPLEGWGVADPPFDDKTAETLVEIATGLLNDGAAALVRAVAKKETGDQVLADAAAKEVRMSQKIEACVKRGAVECAKKYAVRLDYAPEVMLGGGLLLWAGQLSMSIQALKAKGKELRAETAKNANNGQLG